MGRYVRGEETWIAVDGSDESPQVTTSYKRRLQLVTAVFYTKDSKDSKKKLGHVQGHVRSVSVVTRMTPGPLTSLSTQSNFAF